MRRRLFLIAALLSVTACGPLAQNQPLVGALKGLANTGSGFWEEGRDPRQTLTREMIDTAPTNLLLFAPVNEDLASVFARVSRNGDLITWVSDNGVSLTLRDGVVIATRGLGDDLMGTTAGQVYEGLVSGGGHTVRIHDYLDGEDQIVRREYVCEIATLRSEAIEIYQHKHQTRLISETCTGDAGGFRNLYWIDAAGMIWQSRQWVSPRVGAVDIQIL
ncbi:MAG: YjbF family lipoprotein [Yoonia sp.]